ncbi:hypothetical protein BDN71DRAFT_1394024 [Pleurotus eryngii]|uniref:Uncharacterized protein n=1 Tax=Pleurotus eryngii TaxID=5323 RepID=A0A9P5ZWH0_PLEER|nr:hypothetical protein BDN71DRAFT_1394024 [Pleurotus eryngii]
MGAKAKINQSNPTKPPTLDEGNVDASILWDWFNKCEGFFHHKAVKSNKKIVFIAWRMSGIHAVHWLSANSP